MRKDQCSKCGKCCKLLRIAIAPTALVDYGYVEARRIIIEDVEGKSDWAAFFIDYPCKYLKDDMTCTIYESRPDSCSEYPACKEDKIEGCTFKFEEDNG